MIRILAFARPYWRQIALFLVLVVIGSALVVATPLLFKKIVDDGVIPGNSSLVTGLALLVALIAVAEAALTLAQRWYSARIRAASRSSALGPVIAADPRHPCRPRTPRA